MDSSSRKRVLSVSIAADSGATKRRKTIREDKEEVFHFMFKTEKKDAGGSGMG